MQYLDQQNAESRWEGYLTRTVYLFTEEAHTVNNKDTKETNFFLSCLPMCMVFSHNDNGKNNFHKGPIQNLLSLQRGSVLKFHSHLL